VLPLFEFAGAEAWPPWSRATPGGAKVVAGYFTIKNSAAAPDRLVSVTADIAGRAGIHQMSMTDGMMKMRELTDGLQFHGRLGDA
jgi:periplasmic copper chaperone A